MQRLGFLLAVLAWAGSAFAQTSPLGAATEYDVSSFAGASGGEGSADGTGAEARFYAPSGIWGDDANLFIADGANHAIRKIVLATGQVTTLAGAPGPSASVDGVGTAARFGFIEGLWGDGTFLYVADLGNRTIRKVEIASGNVTTLAGSPGAQALADGTGSAARFLAPRPIWGDGTNLYVGDISNSARLIRRVSISTGQVTTIANLTTVPNGSAFLGLWGDGSNLWIADAAADTVRKLVLATGQITTLAGLPLAAGTADGGASAARFNGPSGVWGDGTNLFVADSLNATIRQVSMATGDTTTIAGLASQSGSDDGLGPLARFDFPFTMWGTGTSLYVNDYGNSTIRRVDTSTTTVETIAGSAPTATDLLGPTMLWGDASNLYIADTGAHTIRSASLATGALSVMAGAYGVAESVDGTGTSAHFWSPFGITGDSTRLFVTEAGADTIRQVQLSNAQTSTLAGNASANSGFAEGTGKAARFFTPLGIWGNGTYLWVADRGNSVIRRIVAATGQVATFVGAPNQQGTADGPGPSVRFVYPQALWGDSTYLYVADGHAIRRVTIATAQTTTIAGDILNPGSRDGIGNAASFNFPLGLWGDGSYLFVADSGNSTIRKIDLSNNSVSTIVGAAQTPGSENGRGSAARLDHPIGLWGDGTFLYVSDNNTQNIRRISPSGWIAFNVVNRGGVSVATTNAGSSTTTTGYGRILPAAGSPTPAGLAIFGYTIGNVLVSEAAVPAGPLMQAARIYSEVQNSVNTGVAIANPNDQPALLQFYFTNAAGVDMGAGSASIPARGQIAAFLDQPPFSTLDAASLAAMKTFTIMTSVPVSIVTLRGFTNERSEFLITTLPVTPLNATIATPLIFPHFADGGGWRTQVILVNPGDETLNGTLQFFSPGSPASAGQLVSSSTYAIAPRSSFKFVTTGSGSAVQTGSVRVMPGEGTPAPAGLAVFSFKRDQVTVTEAGVPALPVGSAFRLYAEASGNFNAGEIGSMQTGFAIANSASSPVTVSFELTTLDGAQTGLTGTTTIPGNGQIATFLNQLDGFRDLPSPFRGMLRIVAPGISVVGLRGRYNQRGEFLITTTSPVDEATPPSTDEFVFAHLAAGGGYSTQFILFSGSGSNSGGTIRFFDPSGQPLTLPLR